MPTSGEHRDINGSYFYPGRLSDYLFQAFRFAAVVMCGMAGLYVLVLGADVVFFGEKHVGPGQFVLVLGMGGLVGLVSVIMALSLSRFGIVMGDQVFTVYQGAREVRIPYKMVTAIEKVRIPGWWPLRADLKPRSETARAMIRIKLDHRPPLSFVSGLDGEDELIARITKSSLKLRVES